MGLKLKAFLAACVVMCGFAATAPAQPSPANPPSTTTIIEPPAPLLPAHLDSMQLGVAVAISAADLKPEQLSPTCELQLPEPSSTVADADNCLAILKEDGLQRAAVGMYQAPGRHRVAHALQFGDATGAFSAFTFYRSRLPELRQAEFDLKATRAIASSATRTTLIWYGTTVLAVDAPLSKAETEEWIAALPRIGGRRALPPLLPTLLPEPGLTSDATRYALGPVGYKAMNGILPPADLGWDKSLETATTTYTGKSGKGTLTLLLYPTPQIAGDRGRVIEKQINDLGPSTFGTVKMRRIGPLVGVTSGAFAPEQALALVNALHLNEEVTFDQKLPLEFHAEVRKTASLLENIAVLCGILILTAILLGFFLGGARAGIRVLLGKPAATEPEFLTINLRDRPKALFSRKSRDEGDAV